MCCLLTSEACFFSCIAPYRVQLIVHTDPIFIQECVCACGFRKWERLISHANNFLHVSYSLQARSQVLRFGGKYIFRREYFCFYYMFKTNFSGHNKIREGHKKILGGPARECLAPCLGAWSFEQKWRSLLQEWSILHCRFNSLVQFDWGNYVTFHLRLPLKSPLQSFL